MANRYSVPGSEAEKLPNRLGIEDPEEIQRIETLGFIACEADMSSELSPRTDFNNKYLKKLHLKALGFLYDFAGEYRSVDVAKDGFNFPKPLFLHQSMNWFERELLVPWQDMRRNPDDAVRQAASIHAELLFIHPFREGNGRTARLFSKLMLSQAKIDIRFPDFKAPDTDPDLWGRYICAVKSAPSGYGPMIELFNDWVSACEP